MERRQFILYTLATGLQMTGHPGAQPVRNATGAIRGCTAADSKLSREHSGPVTLFLCGDVMTGRGIDQVLPHPGNPRLHEEYMGNAGGYVELAEEANGPIPKPVSFSYIWGDSLAELERMKPDVRIINLETAVTRSDDAEDKPVNYRMNPDNIPCITAANIDCCILANNHVLDWGYRGLDETLSTLQKAEIKTAGAGCHIGQARAPAVMTIPKKGRVLVFSYGSETSGIPSNWAATAAMPGVSMLPDFSFQTVHNLRAHVAGVKRVGDIAVVSIHWGGNWGYEVSRGEREFAHWLIDEASIDIVHGHSSHHVKGIEVYKEKLILYGCGDFLNDYEGISGHKAFRGDLALMYFVSTEPATGNLIGVKMIPLQIRNFRLNYVSANDASWLGNVLKREGKKFGTSVGQGAANVFALQWSS